MVIYLLSPLRWNLRGSRHVDFLSRAAHKNWESVNTEDFFGTPICNQCIASSRALFSSSRTSEAGTSPSYGLHNLQAKLGFPW